MAISLKTDLKHGIVGTKDDLEERKRVYKSNANKPRKIKSIYELICECFEDFILKVLCVAAVVTLAVGMFEDPSSGWIEGVSIIAAIVIIVSVTTVNNYSNEKKFQELQGKQDQATAIVVRNGVTTTIDSTELVVGDVVTIEPGKRIPADCILISSVGMSCNESDMTGEPDALRKSHVTDQNFDQNPNPFVLKGSLVEEGQGVGLVAAVGPNTRAGQVEKAMDIAEEQTPLQAKLEVIANDIGKIGTLVAFLTLLVIFLKVTLTITGEPAQDINGNEIEMSTGEIVGMYLQGFVLALSIIICAVPEGLPLAVTIALAFSVAQMLTQHNLVRKMNASETMGNANEICTDKTGTLTKNEMTVMTYYFGRQVYECDKQGGH